MKRFFKQIIMATSCEIQNFISKYNHISGEWAYCLLFRRRDARDCPGLGIGRGREDYVKLMYELS